MRWNNRVRYYLVVLAYYCTVLVVRGDGGRRSWEDRHKIRHITYLAIALLISSYRHFRKVAYNSSNNEGRRLLLSLHRLRRCLFAGEDYMDVCQWPSCSCIENASHSARSRIKMNSHVDTKI